MNVADRLDALFEIFSDAAGRDFTTATDAHDRIFRLMVRSGLQQFQTSCGRIIRLHPCGWCVASTRTAAEGRAAAALLPFHNAESVSA